MADIVFGFGSSHGPLLSTPPEQWDLRADADRKNPAHAYRGGTYSFGELLALRKDGDFAAQNRIWLGVAFTTVPLASKARAPYRRRAREAGR